MTAGTTRSSSVSEVSVEADDVVAAGDRPADLILVHAGQREYAMEGCDNAARMVAERIAATVEHTTTRAVSVVDIADLCSVGADEVARAFRPGGSRALAFVVESAVCTEDPSDELRKFRRALVASNGALLADARAPSSPCLAPSRPRGISGAVLARADAPAPNSALPSASSPRRRHSCAPDATLRLNTTDPASSIDGPRKCWSPRSPAILHSHHAFSPSPPVTPRCCAVTSAREMYSWAATRTSPMTTTPTPQNRVSLASIRGRPTRRRCVDWRPH